MSRILSLIAYLILVVGGGLFIGYLIPPGNWYTQLAKPTFTPPGWLFAPVWTVLYISIAFIGWRISTWRPEIASRRATLLWWTQLAFNFLWTPVFFGLHLIGGGLIVLSLLIIAIVSLIAHTWSRDRIAAVMAVPYAIWVAFAGVLNGWILALN